MGFDGVIGKRVILYQHPSSLNRSYAGRNEFQSTTPKRFFCDLKGSVPTWVGLGLGGEARGEGSIEHDEKQLN